MPWKKLLVWATGLIDEAVRQKLEFELEENRVCRALLDRASRMSSAKYSPKRANPSASCWGR
jgi:hypothetical protein